MPQMENIKMKEGLLWRDNSSLPLAEKIRLAAKRYAEKYNISPDLCFVNPQAYDSKVEVAGIELGPLRTVMVNYLWIGRSQEIIAKEEGNATYQSA